jgi:hypothetical protein
MAVVSTTRTLKGGPSGVDQFGNRTYDLVYRVITDNIQDNHAIVLLAPGLPAIYSIYNAANEFDTGSVLKNYSAARTDDPCIWEVTCHYESWAVILGGLRGSNPELQKALADAAAGTSSHAEPGGFDANNPLSRPPRIRGGSRTYQRVQPCDLDGKQFVNSVGERLDPPPEMDDKRPYLTISRAEPGPLNLTRICQYQDAVNSDVFLGQPAFSAKMNITWERVFENNLLFYDVTYDIEFRRDLWIPLKVLDAGYSTLAAGNVPPGLRMLDASGGQTAAPLPLYTVRGDEGVPALTFNGQPCVAGDIIVLPRQYWSDLNRTQYRNFRVYSALPYAVFNLAVNL